MTQAVILCGGRGSRLGDLTRGAPKPLLDVGGRPFLDILLRQVKRAGCDRVLLLAGHLGEQVERYAVQSRVPFDLDVQVSVEPEPLGTGGALRHARDLLDDEFLLLNGDTFFDIDLRPLIAYLNQTPNYHGVVTHPSHEMRPRPTNGGVYAFSREFTRNLPAGSYPLESALHRGPTGIRNFEFPDAYFIDIGTPSELERARRELPVRWSQHQDMHVC